MNFLKSLGSVKKQKDASYRCNYCQFECESQLLMIHHNSSCFFSQYEEMKKNTVSKRIQLKVQDKKQKRAIRNLLNSKRLQSTLERKTQDCNENITSLTEAEQLRLNSLQNKSKNVLKQLSEERVDSIEKKENLDSEQNSYDHENDQFMIKGEDNDFLLSMIVLKLRSDLRLSLEWPKHQNFPKQIKICLQSTTIKWQEDQFIENQELSINEPNALNMNDKEIEDLYCQSYCEQNIGQIFNKINKEDHKNLNQIEGPYIHKEISNIFQMNNVEIQSNQEINNNKQTQSNVYNNQSELQKKKELIQQSLENDFHNSQQENAIQVVNVQDQQQQNQNNKSKQNKFISQLTAKFQVQELKQQIQHDIMIVNENSIDNQDIKSEVITKDSLKLDSSLSSDDENIIIINQQNQTNDKFYQGLQQAHFELINRDQLKEVHKILRNYYDKVRLDTLGIDKIWRLLNSQHSQKILNYKQLLKCLLDLHAQEKVQLDEQKQIVYLI